MSELIVEANMQNLNEHSQMLERSWWPWRGAQHIKSWSHALFEDLIRQSFLLLRGLIEETLKASPCGPEDIILLSLEVFEVDGDDFGFHLDGVEIEPCVEECPSWTSRLIGSSWLRITSILWSWSKVSLLSISEVHIESWVRHDIAKHLQALADELCSLSDVRIEDVKVTHVLVANVAGSCSHGWTCEELLDEFAVALLDSFPQSLYSRTL